MKIKPYQILQEMMNTNKNYKIVFYYNKRKKEQEVI